MNSINPINNLIITNNRGLNSKSVNLSRARNSYKTEKESPPNLGEDSLDISQEAFNLMEDSRNPMKPKIIEVTARDIIE